MDIQDTDENTEPHTPFQKWDFTSKRKYFFIFSSAVTVAGIIILLVFRLNLGIDFASGAR
ncbi:hypothetical protein, partial [Streptococcus pneumoniae]